MSARPAMRDAMGRWPIAALGLGCAAALLYLAVPRSVAAFLALPGDRVVARLHAGEPIGGEEARVLALSRHRALAWADAPALWSELSHAESRLAFEWAAGGRGPDTPMLERAMRSTGNALVRAPTDSEAWARLAYLRSLATGPGAEAGRAYSMALLTGPVKPRQVAYRLELAFRLWPGLTADDRRLVGQFARTSWRYAHREIAATANTPLREGILRAAFAAEPATLAAFEALLAKRPGPSPK